MSCSATNSCQNCTALGCVWCGDGAGQGCHSQFSPYGCLTAVPCADLVQCQRKRPETTDHNQISYVVAGISAVIAVILLGMVWTVWYFLLQFRRKQLRISVEKIIDLELESIANSPYVSSPTQSERYLSRIIEQEVDEIENVIPFEGSIDAAEGRNRRFWQKIPFFRRTNNESSSTKLGNVSSKQLNLNMDLGQELLIGDDRRFKRRDTVSFHINELREKHEVSLSKDCVVRSTFVLALLSSLVIVGLSTASAIMFPQQPQYNICNEQQDWWAIWSSLRHGSLQTKYNTLLSIKNGNYFGVELSDVVVRMYWRQSMIGYWYPNTTYYIPSHSITDVMADISIAPGISQAYSLYALYEADNLRLDIELFASVSVYLFDNRRAKLLGMHLSIDMRDYIVGEHLSTNRKFCSCPND